VGGSAVNSKYRRMQDRFDADMGKLVEAREKYANRSDRLTRMKDACEKVKGTGKTLRTVATATASKGSESGKRQVLTCTESLTRVRKWAIISFQSLFTPITFMMQEPARR